MGLEGVSLDEGGGELGCLFFDCGEGDEGVGGCGGVEAGFLLGMGGVVEGVLPCCEVGGDWDGGVSMAGDWRGGRGWGCVYCRDLGVAISTTSWPPSSSFGLASDRRPEYPASQR